MHTEGRLAPDLLVPPTTGEELAEGLMLLRASTLKVIRLQLAIERQDRRVALEAMDDLVALDDELQKCLATMPAPVELAGLQDALAVERSSLDREKLGLAAEVISARSRVEPPADFPEPEPEPLEVEPAVPAPSYDWQRFRYEEDERTSSSRRWIWAVAVILLLAALVGAAYMLGYLEIVRDWAQR
jgi:hypothetical protein